MSEYLVVFERDGESWGSSTVPIAIGGVSR
jgi:hypothetical protein